MLYFTKGIAADKQLYISVHVVAEIAALELRKPTVVSASPRQRMYYGPSDYSHKRGLDFSPTGDKEKKMGCENDEKKQSVFENTYFTFFPI
jgi:hypothetical protein